MSMLFMEKEFQEAGYETSRWRDDMEVLVVHNYMTEDEFAQVWKVIDETPEEDWSIHYRQHLKQFCLEKFGRDDVENLVAEGKYEITLGWDDKNYDVSGSPLALSLQTKFHNLLQKADPSLELAGFATLQRMQEGVQLKSHTDQHTDPSIKYAAILYLNDDYADGTLFFKNKDIDLRPKPRDLLVFPGNEEYEHGVRFVGAGPVRYVLVGFVKVRGFYDNNKY
jgi:hypothetical protein